MPEATKQDPKQELRFTRHDNFESWYANNVQFHPSEWDLKMVFGELEIRDGVAVVQQHTAMSVTWLQAKLMHYYMSLQLAVFEMTHGKVAVSEGILPPEPTPPTGDLENDPMAKQVYEHIKKAREQFMSSLP